MMNITLCRFVAIVIFLVKMYEINIKWISMAIQILILKTFQWFNDILCTDAEI